MIYFFISFYIYLGDLLLVDVENKDVTFSKKTKSKITSLVWVQQEKPQKKETIDSVLIKVIKILYISLIIMSIHILCYF